MKKLMIAALAIAFGAVAHAASVSWSVTGIQTSGDFETGDGDYATGYVAYLFNNATLAQSEMAAAIAADSGWQTMLVSAMWNAVATGDEGTIYKTGLTASDGTFDGYMVIFNAGTADAADLAFVSNVYSEADNNVHKIVFGELDGDGYLDATSASSWSAVNVPEPTSGLLLLLGMAGLALKRKIA